MGLKNETNYVLRKGPQGVDLSYKIPDSGYYDIYLSHHTDLSSLILGCIKHRQELRYIKPSQRKMSPASDPIGNISSKQ